MWSVRCVEYRVKPGSLWVKACFVLETLRDIFRMREGNSRELERNSGKRMCLKERKNQEIMGKFAFCREFRDFSYFHSINMNLLYLNMSLILTDKLKAALKDIRVKGEGKTSSINNYRPQKGPGVSSDPAWIFLELSIFLIKSAFTVPTINIKIYFS